MEKWLKAIQAYALAKDSGDQIITQVKKPTETLIDFLASEEGEVAVKLLAATNTGMQLGRSAVETSKITYVLLNGEGLQKVTHIVSMIYGYPPDKVEIVSPDKALSLLRSFPQEIAFFGFSEASFISHIREKLDDIASVTL